MRAAPLWLVCGLAACAGQAPPEAPTGAALRSPADELSFILGRWRLVDDITTVEERWVRSPDGALLGSGRVTAKDTSGTREILGFAETLSVVRQGDALIYTAWPTGQDPVAFSRTTMRANDVTFENPAHDFPQRVRYQRTSDTELIATAEGEDPKNGPRVETWTLTRVMDAPAASPAPDGKKEDNAPR